MAAELTRAMRDVAYRASVGLAREKGRFRCSTPRSTWRPMALRLPEDIRDEIRDGGMRNSHLLSIAPTGTISLAFADNASNGIEPAYSWTYTRSASPTGRCASTGRGPRLPALEGARRRGGALPPAFVNALEISARDHMRMQAAIQPFIDAAISKTVNVPEDYPFEDFESLYLEAWHAGLKGSPPTGRTACSARCSRRQGRRRRTSTSPSPTGASASPTRRRWRSRRCAGRTGRS